MAFQPVRLPHVLVPGVILPQVQDLAFPFPELHEISVVLFFQPVNVPLVGGTLVYFSNPSSWLCVIYRLGEGALCPITQVIKEGVKQYWPQGQPLEYSTSDSPPAGLHVPDQNSLSLPGQPVVRPPHSPLT